MSQRDWFDKDYYKVLGVSEKATKEDIKKAYRKLAQRHHPDANKGDADAERRFKDISEAHAILSNDEKRAEYDQVRAFAGGGGSPFGFRPGRQGGVRVNIGDIGDIGDIFGGGRGSSMFDDIFGFRIPQKGQDLETTHRLSFEDAVYGTTVQIRDAKVRIPPGVREGQRIKVAGKGGPSPAGGEPGDLYVVTSVTPHPVFSQGTAGDLHLQLPVTFTEAALGAQVDVPTLDGSVTVKIPPGTQHGKKLRVRGKGGPRPRGGDGDLIVTVEIEVPQKLSKKERQLLEEFASIHRSSPRRHLEAVRAAPDERAS